MTTSCSLVDLDCLKTSRVATAMCAHIKLWNAAHYVQLYGDAKKCSAGNEYAQHGKLLTPLHTPVRSMSGLSPALCTHCIRHLPSKQAYKAEERLSQNSQLRSSACRAAHQEAKK